MPTSSIPPNPNNPTGSMLGSGFTQEEINKPAGKTFEPPKPFDPTETIWSRIKELDEESLEALHEIDETLIRQLHSIDNHILDTFTSTHRVQEDLTTITKTAASQNQDNTFAIINRLAVLGKTDIPLTMQDVSRNFTSNIKNLQDNLIAGQQSLFGVMRIGLFKGFKSLFRIGQSDPPEVVAINDLSSMMQDSMLGLTQMQTATVTGLAENIVATEDVRDILALSELMTARRDEASTRRAIEERRERTAQKETKLIGYDGPQKEEKSGGGFFSLLMASLFGGLAATLSWKNIGKAINPMTYVKLVQELVMGAFKGIMFSFEKIVKIGNAKLVLPKAVTKGFSKVGGTFASFFSTIGNVFGKTTGLSKVFAKATPVVQGVGKAVGGMAKSGGKFFAPLTIFFTVLDSLMGAFTGFFATSKYVSNPTMADRMFGAFAGGFSGLFQIIDDLAYLTGSLFGIESLKTLDLTKTIFGTIMELYEGFKTGVFSKNEWVEVAINYLILWWGRVKDAFADMMKSLKPAFAELQKSLMTFWEAMKPLVIAVGGVVGGAIGLTILAALEAIPLVLKALGHWAAATIGFASDIIHVISKVFDFGTLWETMKALFTGDFDKAFELISGWVGELIASIPKLILSLLGYVSKLLFGAWDIISGIFGNPEWMTDISGILESIIVSVKSLITGSFQSLFDDIVEGMFMLVNGIKEFVWKAIDKAAGLIGLNTERGHKLRMEALTAERDYYKSQRLERDMKQQAAKTSSVSNMDILKSHHTRMQEDPTYATRMQNANDEQIRAAYYASQSKSKQQAMDIKTATTNFQKGTPQVTSVINNQTTQNNSQPVVMSQKPHIPVPIPIF